MPGINMLKMILSRLGLMHGLWISLRIMRHILKLMDVGMLVDMGIDMQLLWCTLRWWIKLLNGC